MLTAPVPLVFGWGEDDFDDLAFVVELTTFEVVHPRTGTNREPLATGTPVGL
jgi:hypothetical protein